MAQYDVEQLIAEVERRPILWDESREDYKDHSRKFAAWHDVCCSIIPGLARKVEIQKRLLIQDVVSKWRMLRDSFVCSMRKNGPASKKMRLHVYGDQLCFLKKVALARCLADSPDGLDAPEDTCQAESEEAGDLPPLATSTATTPLEPVAPLEPLAPLVPVAPSTPSAPPTSGPAAAAAAAGLKRPKSPDVERSILDFLKTRSNLSSPEMDDDVAFFFSLLPVVRSLTPDSKLSFRIMTMQLLQDLKSKCLASGSDSVGQVSNASSDSQSHAQLMPDIKEETFEFAEC